MRRDFENAERNTWLGYLQVLIEQFGEKKFSAKKANLFRDEFRYLDDVQINKVLDKLVGNFKYAPTLDEIKDLTRPYRAENASRSICNQCGNSGFVLLYKRLTGECRAFACKCDNAPNKTKITPYWEVKKEEYTRFAPTVIDFSGKKDCYAGYKTDEHKAGVENFMKNYKEILKSFEVKNEG